MKAHKDYLYLIPILIISAVLITLCIQEGHNWSGDYALYIEQTQALLTGTINKLYLLSKYSNDHASRVQGPYLYPMGFPILMTLSSYFFIKSPMLPLLLIPFLTGIFFTWRQQLHFLIYIIVVLLIYIIWPAWQGMRFVFPILPFIIYFIVKGVERLTFILGIQQRYAITLLICTVSIISYISIKRIINSVVQTPILLIIQKRNGCTTIFQKIFQKMKLSVLKNQDRYDFSPAEIRLLVTSLLLKIQGYLICS